MKLIGMLTMHNFSRNCLVVLFMAAVLTGVAWLAGFTPDGILYGHWHDSDDHSTNWYDTNLHPDAK
jgi:hypothetical protein